MPAPPAMADDGDEHLPFQEGQIIQGRYRVGRLLGSGGMGLVFEGQHLELGNSVAIKVIRPGYSSDPHIVTRFVNEARSVAALESPHIARVFDAGQLESGEAFMVMERLKGRSLATHLQEVGALGYTQLAHYLIEACEGLAQAHSTGLIHRDLKPEHVFIVDVPGARPLVKLLDFGIAKRLSGPIQCRVTNPGDSIGSPCYMSPEQMQNPRDVDARTDIWSLGVVAYEGLTTRKPFDGDTIGHLQWNVLAEPPTPLPQLCPEIPEELERIVMRCLEKSRDDRFASMAELAAALRRFLAHCAPRPGEVLAPPSLQTPTFEPTSINQGPTSDERAQLSQPVVELPVESARRTVRDTPERDTLAPVGVPRRRAVLSWAIFTSVFFGSVAILGLWAFGGVDGLKAATQGLTPDSASEPYSSTWAPPHTVMVKLTVNSGSGVQQPPSVTAVTPELSVEAANALTTRDKPSEAEQARQSTRPASNTAEPALTAEEKQERYERWLASQNLTPVEDVVLAPGAGD